MSAFEAAGKLKLYRGWPDRSRYVVSPFVTKLELRFRHAGLPYVVETGSTRSAPGGKVPYVDLAPLLASTDAAEPRLVGDSTLIPQRLEALHRISPLDGALSARDRLLDGATKALLEDRLYFFHSREKWVDNYYAQRDTALWALPYPMRVVVGALIYRKITAMLQTHGFGRFSAQETLDFRREIWQKLGDLLQSSRSSGRDGQPFWLLGNVEPTEADMVLYGFIVSVLLSSSSPESQALVRSFPVLIEYGQRIHTRYFPDYENPF